MTLDPAVHCSRIRKLVVGIVNENPIATNLKFYFTVSHTMFFRLMMAIH